MKARSLALASVVLILAAAAGSGQQRMEDPLDSLKFLEGVFHGEGKSPYGPYEFEARNERRGRWMLGTSTIYSPGTNQALVTATALIGDDEKGLLTYAFDNAGVTIFRGRIIDGGVRFEWTAGEPHRLRTLRRLDGGRIFNREESYLPAVSKEKIVIESTSLPGKRESK